MRRFVIASAFCLLAGAANAEPPTGSRLGDRTIRGLQYTEEQADEAGTRMASCMAAKRERFARDYLAAKTTAEMNKAREPLLRELSCLGYSNLSEMSDSSVVSMPADILRGKVAEAFLKGERDKIAGLAALPLAKDYSRPWFAATGRDAVVDEMGACVADTNPHGIAGILATRAYSKDEGAAFGAIARSLGPCLRAGANLQANRQALRSALADALYQRLTRPAPEIQAAEAEGTAKRARIQFQRFTECVAKAHSQDARTYILEDLDEQQTTAFRNRMLDEACWRSSTGLQPPIVTTGLRLQGSLAEALLSAESHSAPLSDIKIIAPLKHQPVTDEERRKNDPSMVRFMEAMAVLFEWGECVVRADVDASHALLKSEPATAKESKALNALAPAFAGCMDRGRNLSTSTADLRAAVAVNYYRLAHAPRVAAAPAGVTK